MSSRAKQQQQHGNSFVSVCMNWLKYAVQMDWVNWRMLFSSSSTQLQYGNFGCSRCFLDQSSNVSFLSSLFSNALCCKIIVECSSSEISCQGRLERASLWFLYGDEFVSGCLVFVNQTRVAIEYHQLGDCWCSLCLKRPCQNMTLGLFTHTHNNNTHAHAHELDDR